MGITVRYEDVNAMLLDEFLKEHRQVQAQQAQLSEQQKELQELTAKLTEIESQLPKRQ